MINDKPELSLSLLKPGKRFRPFVLEVSSEFVQAFKEAVSDVSQYQIDESPAKEAGFLGKIAPPGIAGIWGRRSYLEDYRMPGGGVLIGLAYEFERPVYIGDILTARAEVKDITERKGRPVVKIRTEAENQRGEKIGAVELSLIWPK